ncbi:response regulator [Flavivirga abyssicola]|uniref:response regulator n=1 Tax=Flavivirga abyssicola TaxID=3063533 RepID=UPI0026E05206|nr:response regulator [Flavivirga sp. MEBiC07777]WVK14223.1 response regulator [Flavivirga sp. MEBiC07777]
MYKKVLIAEDQQTISKGLKSSLETFGIGKIDTTHYCDNAILKIKAALKKNMPFDLLITDLSFKEDHHSRDVKSGTELIEQVKKIQPDLRIIVFSIENRVGKVKKLLDEYFIDAYISKGRREFEDIKKALQIVFDGGKYYSDSISMLLRNSRNISEVSNSDTLILKLLAGGLKQKQIPEYFKKNNIPSGSKRSIEYRLQELKTIFGAETLPQLISITKDIGLI